MPDALGRGATPKSIAEARVQDAVANEILADMAARRTGNEKLRKASRRELRRQLGAAIFAELDGLAKRVLHPVTQSGSKK